MRLRQMTKVLMIAAGVMIQLTLYGQSDITGSLELYISGILDAIPGASAENYSDPDEQDRDAWITTLGDLIAMNIESASVNANTIGYEVISFTDDTTPEESHYYILQRQPTSNNHWGTYIFNTDACRKQLVIQAPHPKYDLNTGQQGVFVFKQLDAAAFFVSGSHRCNSGTATTCSGSTTACSGVSQAYRVSDVAHNVNSAFHIATEKVLSDLPEAVFIQLHGFAKDSNDPYLIMSNGTRITPTVDYASLIWNELENLDGTLTARIAHLDFEWNKLVALTNTQGRLINNSFNPCTDNATNTQGRFIHIEQEFTRLRADQAGWTLMATALAAVFHCGPITSTEETIKHHVMIYPNPFVDHIIAEGVEQGAQLIIYNTLGTEIFNTSLASEEKISVPHLQAGSYYYRVTDNKRIIQIGKLYKTILN